MTLILKNSVGLALHQFAFIKRFSLHLRQQEEQTEGERRKGEPEGAGTWDEATANANI